MLAEHEINKDKSAQSYVNTGHRHLPKMMTLIEIYIPYSGKFSKDLIFENFESSQAFSKIFFQKLIKLSCTCTSRIFRSGP